MQPKKRSLRETLAHPETDDEERAADRHIRDESAIIRVTWSESEHRLRAGLPPGPEPYTFPVVDVRLLDGDGDGRPGGDGAG